MHCSRCSKAALVEIRMHVGERELTFRRCGRCEAQSWETADGPIPLAHVLDLARARLAARVRGHARAARVRDEGRFLMLGRWSQRVRRTSAHAD